MQVRAGQRRDDKFLAVRQLDKDKVAVTKHDITVGNNLYGQSL